MATRQSAAAVEFALADAKHDILALHSCATDLRDALDLLLALNADDDETTLQAVAKARAAVAALPT